MQFSVFSHLFLEAQLRKVINSPTCRHLPDRQGDPAQRARRVVFRPSDGSARMERLIGPIPRLLSTEGTVDGGRFRFGAAHFEWLLRFGRPPRTGDSKISGKRRVGTRRPRSSSVTSCSGSTDPRIRRWPKGASFAVEHWAAAGFWKAADRRASKSFKQRECPDLPLAFWTWHDRVEDQHAAHTD